MELAFYGGQRILAGLLRQAAQELGIPFNLFGTPEELLAHRDEHGVTVLVIGVHEPGLEHYALCRDVTRKSPPPEVYIVGTVSADPEIERLAVEAGAVAYFGRWDPELLPKRISHVLRSRIPGQQRLDLGLTCRLDVGTRQILGNGLKTQLTGLECFILQTLVIKGGEPASYAELTRVAWGGAAGVHRNAIYQPLHGLRRHLAAHGLDACLQTVHGMGYRYVVSAAQDDHASAGAETGWRPAKQSTSRS